MTNIDTLIEQLVTAVAEYALGRGDHAAVVLAKAALRAEFERVTQGLLPLLKDPASSETVAAVMLFVLRYWSMEQRIPYGKWLIGEDEVERMVNERKP